MHVLQTERFIQRGYMHFTLDGIHALILMDQFSIQYTHMNIYIYTYIQYTHMNIYIKTYIYIYSIHMNIYTYGHMKAPASMIRALETTDRYLSMLHLFFEICMHENRLGDNSVPHDAETRQSLSLSPVFPLWKLDVKLSSVSTVDMEVLA